MQITIHNKISKGSISLNQAKCIGKKPLLSSNTFLNKVRIDHRTKIKPEFEASIYSLASRSTIIFYNPSVCAIYKAQRKIFL